MRYIESFFLGVLIACTALITQVFVSIFMEIFFHHDFVLTSHAQFIDVAGFFLIAAVIEELLRYIVIKKRVIIYVENTFSAIALYGAFLGIGFWSIELILGLTKNTALINDVFSLFTVLCIHVVASILLIAFVYRNKIIYDFFGILCTIIFHVSSNLILFYILS